MNDLLIGMVIGVGIRFFYDFIKIYTYDMLKKYYYCVIVGCFAGAVYFAIKYMSGELLVCIGIGIYETVFLGLKLKNDEKRKNIFKIFHRTGITIKTCFGFSDVPEGKIKSVQDVFHKILPELPQNIYSCWMYLQCNKNNTIEIKFIFWHETAWKRYSEIADISEMIIENTNMGCVLANGVYEY